MAQVVIGDILPYTQAIATGGQTVFGTNWTADYESDVQVYQTPSGDDADDVTQILPYPAAYSVAFIGALQEVQVTLVTPASAGDRITIIRNTPADRENLYSNTNFTPSMLNQDFGILTMVDQQAQLVNQKIGPRYNYSAVIEDVVDTILPILGANQSWMKNSNNDAIIPLDVPSGGIAPADATYITYGDQTSVLPNSFRLLAGTNVSFTSGTNTLTISVSGQAIRAGSQNDLAYYAADGTVLSPLSTANNGVLVTSGIGAPSISSTLPASLTIPSPIIDEIYDASGNIVLKLASVPSAVNYLDVVNSATGDLVSIQARGSDSIVGLEFRAKNNGAFRFSSSATNGVFEFYTGTGYQHLTNWNFPNTAATRNVTWQDADGTLAYLSDIPSVIPSALTKTDDTNVTLTLGGSPSTALLNAASLTLGWTGTLSGTRGGTGVNNGSNTATFAGNLNFANSFTTSGNFAVTQTYTGITNVTFPTSGTLATTSQIPTGAALTKSDDTNVTLTLGGSPTTALLNAASLTLGWTGQLGLTRGGTNASLSAVNGGILYSTASALAISAAGSSGQILQSAGAATPVWTTATYPATAGTANNYMKSDGTNWISTAPAALTKSDDTNVTLTLGGSASTALLNAASLTLGWTGQLGVSRGGTGAGTLTGLLTGNGTSAITGTAITQYNVLTGGASNVPNSVAPSATSGVPLISQGSSSQPVFGTAVVAGGGTGLTTTTAYGLITGGTTATGNFQNAGTGTSGQIYISGGASALGTWTDSLGSNKVMRGTTASWTPAISPGAGAFGSISYSQQTGEYTQIGNVLYWFCNIQLSAFTIGTASSYFSITGIPTSSTGSGALSYTGSTVVGNITYTGNTVVPVVSGGSSTIVFVASASGAGTYVLQCSDLSASSKIYASGFFFTS